MNMTKDQIKYMVDRFLCWRLPKPWNPDGGISYTRPNYAHAPTDSDWPVGTNLFDATEAAGMVRHMLDGMPEAALTEYRWLIERGDSEVSRPLYWTGTATGDNTSAWAFDANNAIGFTSEAAAAVIAHNLMGRGDGRILCRVKEHGFG